MKKVLKIENLTPVTKYTITVSNDGHGTGASSLTQAQQGQTIILTNVPSTGYQFKEWQVVSGGITITNNSFTMPANDVEVKAVFETATETEYTITVVNDGNGTAVADKSKSKAGQTITLTSSPNTGYEFDAWEIVTGIFVISNNQFVMPAENVKIKGKFKVITSTNHLYYWYDATNTTLHLAGTQVTSDYIQDDADLTDTSANKAWASYKASATKVVIDNAIKPTSMAYWFYLGSNIAEFDGLDNVDTSSCTNMTATFAGDSKVTALTGIENWDVSKVTTLGNTFSACSSLTSLDLSSWNPTSATTTAAMFANDTNLVNIICPNAWSSISSITVSTNMFNNCKKLVGAISYNASKVTIAYADTSGYFLATSPTPSCTLTNNATSSYAVSSRIYGYVNGTQTSVAVGSSKTIDANSTVICGIHNGQISSDTMSINFNGVIVFSGTVGSGYTKNYSFSSNGYTSITVTLYNSGTATGDAVLYITAI